MKHFLSELFNHKSFDKLKSFTLNTNSNNVKISNTYGDLPVLISKLLPARNIVYIAPADNSAYLARDILSELFPNYNSLFIPSDLISPTDLLDSENSFSPLRLLPILNELLESKDKNYVIVMTYNRMKELAPGPSLLIYNRFNIVKGEKCDFSALIRQLGVAGFERIEKVVFPGEFSVRGSIIDFFNYINPVPIRIEFEFDLVKSIREFNPETQDSIKELNDIQINLSGKAAEMSSWREWEILKYFMEESVFHFEIPENDKKVHNVIEESKPYMPKNVNCYYHYAYDNPKADVSLDINKLNTSFANVNDLKRQAGSKYLALITKTKFEKSRAQKLLKKFNMDIPVKFYEGLLDRGFITPSMITISYRELFKKEFPYHISGREKISNITDYEEILPGDIVVHSAYGVGKYLGLKCSVNEGIKREYICLRFKNHQILYVPVFDIDLISKYIGNKTGGVKLSKLNSKNWELTKGAAFISAKNYAKEMLILQAIRNKTKGEKMIPNSDWEDEFDAGFPYVETEDQFNAINETKRDMESDMPMDRLICGDVGFGKTEIAMRAAFRAVMSGKQVCLIAPTTILVQQHYERFKQRISEFPVSIEYLSRFKTKKEQALVIEKMSKGVIDIVIGTHRLFQDDIMFRDLGLLIIDEEQKFGVEHKEKIKRIKTSVNVLTLTATPIPRTLHMSLLGLKDISNLHLSPADRLSINTYVGKYNNNLVKEAIYSELNRNGQVFYLHNRIFSISKTAEKLRRLVPEANIKIVHGRMHKDEVENNMYEFMRGKIDVLVSTTIIESGLDIPNANTIIVEYADKYGLAELHQLRGRVGRYKQQAFGYFLTMPDSQPTSEGKKRLSAIKKFSELGAGYKIALQDLQLRGAGNILGKEQSGFINSVGYNLYCKLLKQSTSELKGDILKADIRPEININLNLFIPEDYIPWERLRMELYKKIFEANSINELVQIKSSVKDRYGAYENNEINNVFDYAELLLKLRKYEIISLKETPVGYRVKFNKADYAENFLLKNKNESFHSNNSEVIIKKNNKNGIKCLLKVLNDK